MADWWDFAKRHKKKLLAGSVLLATGGALAYFLYNVRKKLREIQDLLPPPPPPVNADQISVLRMQVHLQTAMADSERSVRNHMAQVTKLIAQLEDLDSILAQLQKRPGKREKHQLWEKLKLGAYVRASTTAITMSILAVLVHVQVTILARLAFRQSVAAAREGMDCLSDVDVASPLSDPAKLQFLLLLSHFLTHGVTHLHRGVSTAVSRHLDRKLTGEIGPSEMEMVLASVSRELLGDGVSQGTVELSEWITPPEGDCLKAWATLTGSEKKILTNLKSEIVMIVSSVAFSHVITSLVSTASQHAVALTFPNDPSLLDMDCRQPVLSSDSPSNIAASPAATSMNSSMSSDAPPDIEGSGSFDSRQVPRVILRLVPVTKSLVSQDGEAVGLLCGHPLLRELCSIVFTSDTNSSQPGML